jgi:hypothetical protein
VPVVLPAVGEIADTLRAGGLGPPGELPRHAAPLKARAANSARRPNRVRTNTEGARVSGRTGDTGALTRAGYYGQLAFVNVNRVT